MLESAKSHVKNFAFKMSSALRDFERFCKICLRKLSEFRHIFYTVCFYLIMRSYSNNIVFKLCGLVFTLYSLTDYYVQRSKLSPKRKYTSFTILNIFLIIASIIVTYTIGEKLMFFYRNYYTMFANAKSFVTNHPSLVKKIFTFGKLIAIPISAISTIYYKCAQYTKLPMYQKIPQQVNIFNGASVKTDIMREDLKIPVIQILSLVINGVSANNPISALVSLMDVLMLFTNYAGHKKRFFYYPMILSCTINVLTALLNLSGLLGHNHLPISVQNLNKS